MPGLRVVIRSSVESSSVIPGSTCLRALAAVKEVQSCPLLDAGVVGSWTGEPVKISFIFFRFVFFLTG